MRYLLKQHLTSVGLKILEADSGVERLRLARTQQPDAIVVDWMMPGLSGLEVLDQLRSDPDTQAIPVIFHSSELPTAEQQAVLENCTVAVLTKSSPQKRRSSISGKRWSGRDWFWNQEE